MASSRKKQTTIRLSQQSLAYIEQLKDYNFTATGAIEYALEAVAKQPINHAVRAAMLRKLREANQ